MHRKRSDKVNKMMVLKLSQITSVIYKLQCSIESLGEFRDSSEIKCDSKRSKIFIAKNSKTKND